jgi:hypothetical protein
VQEKPELKNTYNSGPEYQVIDNDGHPDAKNGPTASQAPTTRCRRRPGRHQAVGDWNQADSQERRARRALAQRRKGRRVRAVERCLEGAGGQEQVQRDAGVRTAKKGYLALQDHGNPVSFRSLKIKVLPSTKARTELGQA